MPAFGAKADPKNEGNPSVLGNMIVQNMLFLKVESHCDLQRA